jgi:hypothetical protein
MELDGLLSHSQVPPLVPILSPIDPVQAHLSDFSHLRLGLIRDSFIYVYPINTVRTSRLPHTCHMPCPSRSSWFVHTGNVRSIVLCSLVIWCLWCHSNTIQGENDAICVPDTADTNTDVESWYWILLVLAWGNVVVYMYKQDVCRYDIYCWCMYQGMWKFVCKLIMNRLMNHLRNIFGKS